MPAQAHPDVVYSTKKVEIYDSKEKAKNLAICVFGVVGSYVIYNLLFERLVTKYQQASEIGIIFFSNIVYASIAYALLYFKGKYPVRIPWIQGARVSLCIVAAGWCTSRALRYINVPTQTIAKSCKPFPTMLLGIALGKRYNRLQYLCTLVICIGVLIFNMSSITVSRREEENHLQGLLLILVALVLDGATGALEDSLVHEMGWKHGEGGLNLMFFLHLFAIPFSFTFSIASEGFDGIRFVSENFIETATLSLVGAVGQIFIFHTISTNGALTCCVVTTCRKMFTVILSVAVFGHMITSLQVLGILLTFIGLGLDIHQKLVVIPDSPKMQYIEKRSKFQWPFIV